MGWLKRLKDKRSRSRAARDALDAMNMTFAELVRRRRIRAFGFKVGGQVALARVAAQHGRREAGEGRIARLEKNLEEALR